MTRLQIFRPGRHTAMSGEALKFSKADLRAIADCYDPALHEAPIVIGHPELNKPAFGWVKSLHFEKGFRGLRLPLETCSLSELTRCDRLI